MAEYIDRRNQDEQLSYLEDRVSALRRYAQTLEQVNLKLQQENLELRRQLELNTAP